MIKRSSTFFHGYSTIAAGILTASPIGLAEHKQQANIQDPQDRQQIHENGRPSSAQPKQPSRNGTAYHGYRVSADGNKK